MITRDASPSPVEQQPRSTTRRVPILGRLLPTRRSSAHEQPLLATRRRLVVMNLLVVSAILAVMAVAVYFVEAHAINAQVDGQLRSVSSHLQNDTLNGGSNPLDGDGDQGGVPPGGQPHDDHYQPSSPNIFSVWVDTNGNAVSDPANVTSLGLPDKAAALQSMRSGQSVLVMYGVDPHEYRLYTVPVHQDGKLVGALQVGTSLDARESELHDLLVTLALVGAGVLVLTALASVYLAERALVPTRLAFERQRQFTAAASHELRTPLAMLRSQADLVLRALTRSGGASPGQPDDSASRLSASIQTTQQMAEDVGEIIAEVDYMSRLVHDLLLLARNEHDGRLLDLHLVNLSEMATDAVEKLRPQAEQSGLTVDTQIPGPAPIVRGDSDRLRQVVLILLDNAFRYTPPGGRIEVTVRNASGGRLLGSHRSHAELTVRDTGMGIDPAQIERIFEPFYRADAARAVRADGKRGSGLGLALARWIVTAHGGQISVESTPGRGSTFTVRLPLAPSGE